VDKGGDMMGGCDFRELYVGTKSPAEAFKELVKDAMYEYGHGGYSGTIKEKDGYRMLLVPYGVKTQDVIDEMLGANDKWGPAFCVEIKGEELDELKEERGLDKGPQSGEVRAYVFFGIASC
jgi:hypothetical protein